MPTNPFFKNFTYKREQKLVEDLSIEAVKLFGYDLHYIPRTIVNEDILLGEDTLSTFDSAPVVEAYIKNVDGFEGQGDLLSKFGLEIRDQITFSIPRKRFDQIRTAKVLTEYNWNLILESANTNLPQSSDCVEQESSAYTITSSRPMEGDLIYFPLNGKLFEIKFVEHEAQYYQLGKLQNYDIRCEMFEYSSERINVANGVINAIADDYTLDIYANNNILVEVDTGYLMNEDDERIVQELRLEEQDIVANNEFFSIESSTILNMSETNPFGI